MRAPTLFFFACLGTVFSSVHAVNGPTYGYDYPGSDAVSSTLSSTPTATDNNANLWRDSAYACQQICFSNALCCAYSYANPLVVGGPKCYIKYVLPTLTVLANVWSGTGPACGGIAPILWLRADSLSSLAEGDKVSSWPDSSMRVTPAVQATVSKQPTYRYNAWDDGTPCVSFDGIDDVLTGNMLTGTQSTFIAVFKDQGTTIACCSGLFVTFPNYNGIQLALIAGKGVLPGPDGSAVGPAEVGNVAVTLVVTYTATVTTLHVNGVLQSTAVGALGLAGASFAIGSRDETTFNRYTKGLYKEIIVFGSALVDTDRKAVLDEIRSRVAVPTVIYANHENAVYNLAVPSTDFLFVGFTVAIESGQQTWPLDELRLPPTAGFTIISTTSGTLKVTHMTPQSAKTITSLLNNVRFFTTTYATTARVISYSYTLASGQAVYYSAAGHFYENVAAAAITWTAARDACALRTEQGKVGYLMTLTTAAEQTFVNQISGIGLGWLGASDDVASGASEGVWKWVTGPEAGTTFWNAGSCVAGKWCNWAAGEPNNAGAIQHWAHAQGLGTPGANDLWFDSPDNLASITGYWCEYGGLGGDVAPTYTAVGQVTVAYAVTTIRLNKDVFVFKDITTPETSDTFIGFTMTIETGMMAGDVLRLTGTIGYTVTYDSTTGSLKVVTTTTAKDAVTITNLVKVASFFTTHGSRTERTISYSYTSSAGVTWFSETGHYYERVGPSSITWTAARDACALRTVQGKVGYLMTLTTAAEQTFADGISLGLGWLGASDDVASGASEGVWKWVTGPEAGTTFWNAGSCVAGKWCNWAAGEPNDANAASVPGAHWAHADADDLWRDYPQSWGVGLTGYYCEYGGLGGDVAQPYASTGSARIQYTPTRTESHEESGEISGTRTDTAAESLTTTISDDPTFTDSWILTPTPIRTRTETLENSLTLTRTISDERTITLTHTASLDDSATRSRSSSQSATLSLSESWQLSLTRSLSDTVSPELSASMMTESKTYMHSLTTSKSVSPTFEGSATYSHPSRTPTDTLTDLNTVSETHTVTAELSRRTLTLTETRTHSASWDVFKTESLTLVDTVTADPTVSRSPRTVTLTATDSLSNTLSLSATFSRTDDMTETTTASMSLVRSRLENTEDATATVTVTQLVSMTITLTFLEITGPTTFDGTWFVDADFLPRPTITLTLWGDTWAVTRGGARPEKHVVEQLAAVGVGGDKQSGFSKAIREIARTSTATFSDDMRTMVVHLGYDTSYFATLPEVIGVQPSLHNATGHVVEPRMANGTSGQPMVYRFTVTAPNVLPPGEREGLGRLTGAVGLSAAVSPLSAAMLQSMLVITSMPCMKPGTRAVANESAWILSPLHVAFGAFHALPASASVVVWNTILLVGFGFLHFTTTLSLSIARATSFAQAAATLAFPNVTVFMFHVFFLSTVTAALTAVQNTEARAMGILGVLLFLFGLPSFQVLVLLDLPSIVWKDAAHPLDIRKPVQFLLPRGRWLPHDVVLRVGSTFAGYTAPNKYFGLGTLATYTVVSAAASVPRQKFIPCETQLGIVAFILFVFGLVMLIRRPFRSEGLSCLHGVTLLLQSFLPLVNLAFPYEKITSVEASKLLVAVIAVFVFVDAGCNVYQFFHDIRTYNQKGSDECAPQSKERIPPPLEMTEVVPTVATATMSPPRLPNPQGSPYEADRPMLLEIVMELSRKPAEPSALLLTGTTAPSSQSTNPLNSIARRKTAQELARELL